MNYVKVLFKEKEIKINKYKRYIVLLPQDISIYHDFTAKENVSFFCSLYRYRGNELKRRMISGVFWNFDGMSDSLKKIGSLMPQRLVYVSMKKLQAYENLNYVKVYMIYMILLSLIFLF